MKRWIHAATDKWIDKEAMYEAGEFDVMGEEFEELWQTYLSEPESKVNKELQIFPEPSVQGYSGEVFIFDESSKMRFEDVHVDWYDWCDQEMEMALQANNAQEYAELYRNWMKELCGI